MMSHTGLYNRAVQSAFRHLQSLVIAVISKTGNLRQCGRTYHRLAVVLAILRIVELDILNAAFAAHNLSCCHNSVYDLLVTGTATYITGLLEPVANFFTGRVRILLQQCVSGYDKSGNAESALYSTAVPPCYLQRVQMLCITNALDGGDLAVILYCRDLLRTGTDNLSVQNNRT